VFTLVSLLGLGIAGLLAREDERFSGYWLIIAIAVLCFLLPGIVFLWRWGKRRT